jgi:lipopolysaccharide transport system permease protein
MLQSIEPRTGWSGLDLRELWRYRELLFVLTRRNVVVRYKQSALGIGWAVVQPLLLMVVFTFVFGRLAGLGKTTHGVPYSVFTFSALLPWLFFANSITQASNSLVGNTQLVTKVYFPRLVLPLANVLAAFVDFVIAFVILIGIEAAYGIHPRVEALVVVPLALVLAATAALGIGLWLAALNVSYRDVQYVTPFLIQVWFFMTPVVYASTEIASGFWRTVYSLNPMVSVIAAFRWAMIDRSGTTGVTSLSMIVVSASVAVLLAVTGALFFQRTERTFADVI